jgi:hypothetical protein
MKFLPQLLLLGKWNTGGARERKSRGILYARERALARVSARRQHHHHCILYLPPLVFLIDTLSPLQKNNCVPVDFTPIAFCLCCALCRRLCFTRSSIAVVNNTDGRAKGKYRIRTHSIYSLKSFVPKMLK